MSSSGQSHARPASSASHSSNQATVSAESYGQQDTPREQRYSELTEVTFSIPFRQSSINSDSNRKAKVSVVKRTVAPDESHQLGIEKLLELPEDNSLSLLLLSNYPTVSHIEIVFFLHPRTTDGHPAYDLEECLHSGEIGNDVRRALTVLWPLRTNCDFKLTVNGLQEGVPYDIVRDEFVNGAEEESVHGTVKDDIEGHFGAANAAEYISWLPGIGQNLPNLISMDADPSSYYPARTRAAGQSRGSGPTGMHTVL